MSSWWSQIAVFLAQARSKEQNRNTSHRECLIWVGGWEVSEWGHDFLLWLRIIIYLVIVTTEPAIDCWLWCVSSGLAWCRYDKSHSGQCLPHTLPLPWPDIRACRSIMTPSLLSNNYTQKYSINSSIEVELKKSLFCKLRWKVLRLGDNANIMFIYYLFVPYKLV